MCLGLCYSKGCGVAMFGKSPEVFGWTWYCVLLYVGSCVACVLVVWCGPTSFECLVAGLCFGLGVSKAAL